MTDYEWDEYQNITRQIDWNITITVTDGYVEVGQFDPSYYLQQPDPSMLRDTVLNKGYSIYNWVGLYFATSADAYQYNDSITFSRSWDGVRNIEVTSGNPDVVQVTDVGWMGKELTALKRGEYTITGQEAK